MRFFAFAAFVAAVATAVVMADDDCEFNASDYPAGLHPVTDAKKCHVYSGDPGIFDGDGDAQPVTTSKAKLCCDRPAAGMYCLYSATNPGAYVTCAKANANSPTDAISMTCKTSYFSTIYSCQLKVGDANKQGQCTTKKASATGITDFDKPPCDYFPPVPAGEIRYFCAGGQGKGLLKCPDNKVVHDCKTGCVTKYEADGKTPCGKSACTKAGNTY